MFNEIRLLVNLSQLKLFGLFVCAISQVVENSAGLVTRPINLPDICSGFSLSIVPEVICSRRLCSFVCFQICY